MQCSALKTRQLLTCELDIRGSASATASAGPRGAITHLMRRCSAAARTQRAPKASDPGTACHQLGAYYTPRLHSRQPRALPRKPGAARPRRVSLTPLEAHAVNPPCSHLCAPPRPRAARRTPGGACQEGGRRRQAAQCAVRRRLVQPDAGGRQDAQDSARGDGCAPACRAAPRRAARAAAAKRRLGLCGLAPALCSVTSTPRRACGCTGGSPLLAAVGGCASGGGGC